MIYLKALIVAVAVVLSAGCASDQATPPSDESVAASVADLYRYAGVSTPIVAQRLLGKHYVPSLDQWSVVACVDLKASGKESKDCNDSFSLILLDTGRWILSGTVNGQYRWTEVVSAD